MAEIKEEKVKWRDPLEYVQFKNKQDKIDKEMESDDFWNGVTLFPEVSIKHQCKKCTEDYQKWLSSGDKITLKRQCNIFLRLCLSGVFGMIIMRKSRKGR